MAADVSFRWKWPTWLVIVVRQKSCSVCASQQVHKIWHVPRDVRLKYTDIPPTSVTLASCLPTVQTLLSNWGQTINMQTLIMIHLCINAASSTSTPLWHTDQWPTYQCWRGTVAFVWRTEPLSWFICSSWSQPNVFKMEGVCVCVCVWEREIAADVDWPSLAG